jgi:acetyltransferase-like isoleucine patch superfamily enzyme
VFRGLALPEYAAYRVSSAVDDPDDAFHHMSQALSLVPGKSGIYLRREFLRMALEACADDVCVCFGTVLSQRGTRLGRKVYIGPHGNIGLCDIGDDVLFGSGVHVLSGTKQHFIEDPDRPINEQGGHFERVHIGANSWVGNGAKILADVGEGCVIGAGSVVTKAIEPWSIAVGNPARVVRMRK